MYYINDINIINIFFLIQKRKKKMKTRFEWEKKPRRLLNRKSVGKKKYQFYQDTVHREYHTFSIALKLKLNYTFTTKTSFTTTINNDCWFTSRKCFGYDSVFHSNSYTKLFGLGLKLDFFFFF